MTYKEMCQTIEKAKILKKKDGSHPNWEEIWNYSPTGELWRINAWYEEALESLKK